MSRPFQGTELGAAQQQAGLQQQGTEYSGSAGAIRASRTRNKEAARSAQEDISNRQLQAATTYGNNSIQNEQFQGRSGSRRHRGTAEYWTQATQTLCGGECGTGARCGNRQ